MRARASRRCATLAVIGCYPVRRGHSTRGGLRRSARLESALARSTSPLLHRRYDDSTRTETEVTRWRYSRQRCVGYTRGRLVRRRDYVKTTNGLGRAPGALSLRDERRTKGEEDGSDECLDRSSTSSGRRSRRDVEGSRRERALRRDEPRAGASRDRERASSEANLRATRRDYSCPT